MKIEDFCENFFRKIVLYIIPLRGLRNEYITRKKSRDYCDIMFYNKKYILYTWTSSLFPAQVPQTPWNSLSDGSDKVLFVM